MDGAPARLLVIDGTLPERTVLPAARGLAFVHAGDLALALRKLMRDSVDAILLGWHGSGTPGVVRRLLAVAPGMPVLVLADLASEAAAEAVLAEGAQDVLCTAEATEARLERTVRRAIARTRRDTGRLEAIMNGLPDLVGIKDPAGRWRYVNPAGERILGLAADDVVGRTDAELASASLEAASALAGAAEADGRAWLGGGPVTAQEAWGGDGSRAMEVVRRPLFHNDGSPWQMVVAARDVTERRRLADALHTAQAELDVEIGRRATGLPADVDDRASLELALIESERRFRDFVTASSDWVWEMGPNFRFAKVGGRVREVLGVEPAWLIGKSPADISAPEEDAIRLVRHIEDLEAHRPFRDFQYKFVGPTGRTLYLRTSGTPVFAADGGFVGYRGTATNVTAEVLAEQRAQKAQRQLSDAIESISEGFVLHDSDGRLVLCNTKFKELYSRIVDVLVPGSPFANIARLAVERGQYLDLDCDATEYVRRRLRQRGSEGCTFIQHLEGDRWVQVSERRTGDGGTVSIRTDITDLRRVQEELRHAKDEAERANRTKSDFLANMSHELRTPLNAIMGFAETMQIEVFGAIANDHYREYVGDIHMSATLLLGLINDLLDIAKIEAGKFELYYERTNLVHLLECCCQMMRERAEAAQLSLMAQVPATLPEAIVDERRMKQIVINLLANAVKFTPSGGAVTVRAWTNPAGTLFIAVTDTGIGMAPEDISVALAAFGQVQSTYTRSQPGTGLGLPLSKRLVEMHGGSLSLHSAVNQGTTVTISLPAERVAGVSPTAGMTCG